MRIVPVVAAAAVIVGGITSVGAAATVPAADSPAPRVAAAATGVRTVVRYAHSGRHRVRAAKRAQLRRERRLAHRRVRAKALTGTLVLRYAGVPTGATLTTALTGPSGFRQTATASRTWPGVRVGTYALAVGGFSAPTPGTARITVSTRYVYVSAGRTAGFTVTVTWTPSATPGPTPTTSPTPGTTPSPAPTPTPTRSPSPTPTTTPTSTPKPSATPTPTPTPTPTSTSNATAEELEVLRLTNQARAQSQDCGTYGVKPAVPPLTMSNQLVTAARAHAADMAASNYFSHTGLDGSSPGDRISRTGYVWRTWGENIAAGYGTPAAVVAGWIDSDGHCANLMGANFTEIGVGYAYGSASSYRSYWVQDFARR